MLSNKKKDVKPYNVHTIFLSYHKCSHFLVYTNWVLSLYVTADYMLQAIFLFSLPSICITDIAIIVNFSVPTQL